MTAVSSTPPPAKASAGRAGQGRTSPSLLGKEDAKMTRGYFQGDLPSSPESLSSSSSKATIRADRDSDQASSSEESVSSSQGASHHKKNSVNAVAGPSHSYEQPWSDVDHRARSISAPNSRSSSFARNLDQLAWTSRSAHHFPAVLHADSSSQQRLDLPAADSTSATRPALARKNSASSGRSRVSSLSAPSSPQLSARRQAGQPGSSARPRSLLFAQGSGFTPASETGHANGRTSKTVGRTRSTSASEASSSTAPRFGAGSSSVPRAISPHPPGLRSHSARTSPSLRPLQPITRAAEVQMPQAIGNGSNASRPAPQRTRSVPQLAPGTPVIYGLGISPTNQNRRFNHSESPALAWDCYFALPPPAPVGGLRRSRDTEDSPPPYTPSGSNLVALANVMQTDVPHGHSYAQHIATSREEGGDEESHADPGLSFVADRAHRRLRSSEFRQRNMNSERSEPISSADSNFATLVDDHAMTDEMRTRLRPDGGTPHATLEADQWDYIERLERPSKLRRFVLTYLLHPLRLLAAIPGCIGTFWLLRNAAIIYVRDGTLLFKEKQALRADIVARPSGLEFALSALWSLATAYHALSFTTLLLRRWLHYYSLLPSLIRLVALQAICWPLVRLTLHILGPLNPLPAWVIISSTTAFSDTVARWVVSNITDESTATFDALLPTETAADATSSATSGRRRRRLRTRRTGRLHKTAMAFWRTIMGAPPQQLSHRAYPNIAAGERGFITESEAEMDSEVDGRQRHNANRRSVSRGSSVLYQSSTATPSHAMRRRNVYISDTDDVTSGVESDGAEHDRGLGRPGNRHIERVGRIFHWDVAVKRNLLPICVMAYMTMWALLIEVTRSRW